MALEFHRDGYVSDENAMGRGADGFLANAKRNPGGDNQWEVTGWAEPMRYDKELHVLTWGLASQSKNNPDHPGGVSYHAHLLAREGLIIIDFNMAAPTAEKLRPVLNKVLAGLRFAPARVTPTSTQQPTAAPTTNSLM